MKYIRTKDKISLLRKAIGMDKYYVVKDNKYSFDVVIDEETLLKRYKVADTIEELCDVFVEETPIYKRDDVVGIDYLIWLFNKERNCFENGFDEYSHRSFIDDKYNFYGAIWTNEGLIYVAKLNKKGEFELC